MSKKGTPMPPLWNITEEFNQAADAFKREDLTAEMLASKAVLMIRHGKASEQDKRAVVEKMFDTIADFVHDKYSIEYLKSAVKKTEYYSPFEDVATKLEAPRLQALLEPLTHPTLLPYLPEDAADRLACLTNDLLTNAQSMAPSIDMITKGDKNNLPLTKKIFLNFIGGLSELTMKHAEKIQEIQQQGKLEGKSAIKPAVVLAAPAAQN